MEKENKYYKPIYLGLLSRRVGKSTLARSTRRNTHYYERVLTLSWSIVMALRHRLNWEIETVPSLKKTPRSPKAFMHTLKDFRDHRIELSQQNPRMLWG